MNVQWVFTCSIISLRNLQKCFWGSTRIGLVSIKIYLQKKLLEINGSSDLSNHVIYGHRISGDLLECHLQSLVFGTEMERSTVQSI